MPLSEIKTYILICQLVTGMLVKVLTDNTEYAQCSVLVALHLGL